MANLEKPVRPGKKQGEIIWGFGNGIDLSPVLAQPAPNKGYGNSTTVPFDVKAERLY